MSDRTSEPLVDYVSPKIHKHVLNLLTDLQALLDNNATLKITITLYIKSVMKFIKKFRTQTFNDQILTAINAVTDIIILLKVNDETHSLVSHSLSILYHSK